MQLLYFFVIRKGFKSQIFPTELIKGPFGSAHGQPRLTLLEEVNRKSTGVDFLWPRLKKQRAPNGPDPNKTSTLGVR